MLKFSVTCQAKPLTECFFVELQKNADYPDQSFSLKRDRRTFPDIADTNTYPGSASPFDDKQQRSCSFVVKIPPAESISRHLPYATDLLVGYKLILTNRDALLDLNPYSWIPIEVIAAVYWLLKNYWNPSSPPFNPIEQKEANQDHPFAIVTMMLGSGDGQQSHRPSESSRQQTHKANTHTAGSFNRPLNTDYGAGNDGPQQDLHSLDLNCFVFPCYGVCCFRPSSDSRKHDESPLSWVQSSCRHLARGQCISCIDYFDLSSERNYSLFNALNGLPATQLQCDSDQPSKTQTSSCDSSPECHCNLAYITSAEAACAANISGQPTCDVTVIQKNGQQRPCGKVCKNAKALSVHRSMAHSGKKTCGVSVVREDGLLRPCGQVCKNACALSDHKRKEHTGQQTCDVILVGENGQPRPCGIVLKNALSLSSHKSKVHSGQRACSMTVVGENGQPRPCGTTWKNVLDLLSHKRRTHSNKQACEVTVIGKDGLQRPCGKICSNTQALYDHKKTHRKRKALDLDRNDGLSSK
ncbi:hypothetical protein [Endozoicomonas sp. ISHI1]|uniref:hypothetical protein n=1 Tax=Endozoicomonas sp. ISHI1 TaxID=2825882 RepID=UPI002147EB08|nr:hypothetical protein [Endozoicomonas sp. ISHI1]